MRDTDNRPTQHVYHGYGFVEVRMPSCAPPDRAGIKIPTIADSVPATWIMSRVVVCAREDLTNDAVMELMLRHKIGCVPVVDAVGVPIGMITKHDVVEQIVAAKHPDAIAPASVAGRLMMPLALTLKEHATVAHAAAMMALEDVHHVPIVSDAGFLIGVISSMDIVRWLAENDDYVKRSSTAEADSKARVDQPAGL